MLRNEICSLSLKSYLRIERTKGLLGKYVLLDGVGGRHAAGGLEVGDYCKVEQFDG